MIDWHLYIVRCSDGTLYTGVTTDVKRRINEHIGKTGGPNISVVKGLYSLPSARILEIRAWRLKWSIKLKGSTNFKKRH